MSAEANTFGAAALTGVSTAAQAQTFLEAACKSSLCQTPANFLSAYNLYSGAGSTGLGALNGTTKANAGQSKPHATAMLSALIANSATSVALNNLICLTNASNQATVQDGVGNVTRLQQPTYSVLLPNLSGEIAQELAAGVTVSNIVAPPPPTSAFGIAGTWVGSMTVGGPSACVFDGGSVSATFVDNNGTLSGNWTDVTFGSTGAITGVETGAAGSWSASGSGMGGTAIFVNAAISNNDSQIIGSFTSTYVCAADPNHGTISGKMQLNKQ